MVFKVINNPSSLDNRGFSPAQFRKLDDLFLRAASNKILINRAVDVDLEDGIATYSYYAKANQPPVIQFIARRVGPQTVMYEAYAIGKGRIAKSELFDRVHEKIRDFIADLK